jgi:hypothetical protein
LRDPDPHAATHRREPVTLNTHGLSPAPAAAPE